ncbi:hypothetical protein VTL71DRAFT_3737 [Oculimacula yallundae]|uniref:Uncharacterized protein n=1 Tax=Oculimacula yallundae TaxID=86028 RepID=A0ABR4C4J9_9HELO
MTNEVALRADNSRQSSPEPHSLTETSESSISFFSVVTRGGFPEHEDKIQPWKQAWNGPQKPSSDGRLLVGCPKKTVYGSNVLGGY